MRMANHFRPGTPLFICILSSRSLRAITAYVLFARFTFKAGKTLRNVIEYNVGKPLFMTSTVFTRIVDLATINFALFCAATNQGRLLLEDGYY